MVQYTKHCLDPQMANTKHCLDPQMANTKQCLDLKKHTKNTAWT